MRQTGIIIGIIVVIGAIAAAVVISSNSYNNSTKAPATTASPTASVSASSASPSNTVAAGETITYSGGSFSPTSITVKAGTSVTVKNASDSEVDFDSDPHPVHTDNPELNLGPIAAGQSKSFTVTKTGTWGYHNHLNPSQRGSIVVQ